MKESQKFQDLVGRTIKDKTEKYFEQATQNPALRQGSNQGFRPSTHR